MCMYYLVRSMHAVAVGLCVLIAMARAAFAAHKAVLLDEVAVAYDAQGNDLRSASTKEHFENQDSAASDKVEKAIAASKVLEAAVFLLMAGGFLLFSPACIVMFHRVERRLDSIMQEMNHRSDLGTVFLPFEFSPPAVDGSQSQVEMQIVEARAFLGRLSSVASAQRWRFALCMLLVLAALLLPAVDSFFNAVIALANQSQNKACGICASCQPIGYLMQTWYFNRPELFPLVISTCSTLPLIVSLWLMMTKEDRELMLHPRRFRTDSIDLRPVKSEMESRLKSESVRMGVELL
jgi:hypothetical protein